MNVKGVNEDKETEALPVEHVIPDVEELKIIPQKSYKCELCGYSVKTKANLRVHRVKTHRIIESNDDLSFLYRMKQNVRKVYHCPIDGCKYQNLMKGFSKYSSLRQHYVWVHEARRYMCTNCFRPFPTATLLEKHRQSCGQFHVCRKCGRRYAELKYLRQHIKRMKHYETDDVAESSSKQPGESNNIPNVVVNVNPNLTKSISTENESGISDMKVDPPPMNNVQTTLQPIILPVIIPVPVSSSPAKNETGFALDSSGISEAISTALRPVLERISSDISTQTAAKLSDSSTIIHNGILYGESPNLDGKKLSVDVDSNTYINLPTNVAQNTVGLETEMHNFLQPVGSQTDDLFGSFDRQCLHVETQTNATVDKMLMTQVSPHLPQQTTSVVQVAMTPPSAHLEDKKLTASVGSEAFIHIPTSLAQTSVALGTEINPLLQPVGSQTEDLFASFDRSFLHVETQTTNNQHIDVFTEVSRNLQTPQPAMVGAQALVTNNVTAEFLTHMQTQTDPIDAWIEAELSDIETQTYDLDGYLVASCSQPKENI